MLSKEGDSSTSLIWCFLLDNYFSVKEKVISYIFVQMQWRESNSLAIYDGKVCKVFVNINMDKLQKSVSLLVK